MSIKNKGVWTVAILIVAVVLAGEVITYAYTDKYDADATYSDGQLNFSVSVSGSKIFSVIAMDNGKDPTDMIYIYYDEGYRSNYESEYVPVGSHPLDQEYYIDQLVRSLDYMGGPSVKILSADELKKAMSEDISTGGFRRGLVVLSGALPETIYEGLPGDIIFEWLDLGGSLYWAGGLIGAYYSTPDEIISVTGYQSLFFGVEDCLNTGDLEFASKDADDEMDIRYLLSLKNNRVKYGIETSNLPNDREYLAVGYSEEGYSSIVLVEYGAGMICVLAGDYSRNQRSDLVFLLSSDITEKTKILGVYEGSVRNGTATGSIPIQNAGTHMAAYIYLGGYFPVYGRSFSF